MAGYQRWESRDSEPPNRRQCSWSGTARRGWDGLLVARFGAGFSGYAPKLSIL